MQLEFFHGWAVRRFQIIIAITSTATIPLMTALPKQALSGFAARED
jgi:hypothetical protein